MDRISSKQIFLKSSRNIFFGTHEWRIDRLHKQALAFSCRIVDQKNPKKNPQKLLCIKISRTVKISKKKNVCIIRLERFIGRSDLVWLSLEEAKQTSCSWGKCNPAALLKKRWQCPSQLRSKHLVLPHYLP